MIEIISIGNLRVLIIHPKNGFLHLAAMLSEYLQAGRLLVHTSYLVLFCVITA